MSGGWHAKDTAALTRQLEARRHAMLAAAQEAGGSVDAAQLAQLERLQKLLDMERAALAARSAKGVSRRWQVSLAVVAALVMLSLLLLRLPSARIAVQVEATHARVVLQHATQFAPDFPVRWIVSEGHAAAHVSTQGAAARPLQTAVLRADARRPPQEEASAEPASIMVRLPMLPAGAEIGLSAQLGDGSVAITLCGLQQPVVLNMTGPARLSGAQVLELDGKEPARIFLVPDLPDSAAASGAAAGAACASRHALRLRFMPLREPLEVKPDIPVRHLALFAEVRGGDASIEPQSTLLGGTLQVVSVKGAPRPLSKGMLLELADAAGRLRNAQLSAKAVTFEFEGRVSGLYEGSPYVRESLMPRLLQWWLSQELVLVAWSGGLTLLGLAMGLSAWYAKGRP